MTEKKANTLKATGGNVVVNRSDVGPEVTIYGPDGPPAAPPTIYHRLAKVSGAVAYLQKDGKNTGQGYSYLSEAHVKKAVTEALGANGLAYGGSDVEILDRYER